MPESENENLEDKCTNCGGSGEIIIESPCADCHPGGAGCYDRNCQYIGVSGTRETCSVCKGTGRRVY